PDAVGGHLIKLDAVHADTGAPQVPPRTCLHFRVGNEQADGLARREVADDLGVDPGDGRELARPVGGVVGPGDPGRPVRLPLGWHAICDTSRSGHGRLVASDERRHRRSVIRHSLRLGRLYPTMYANVVSEGVVVADVFRPWFWLRNPHVQTVL